MADLGSLLGAAGIGGNIGKAIVQLELDSSKYLAEMKTAEGQTVASTNKLGQGFKSFGGIAQTALLGAGVAAAAFGAYAVKAAIEANEANLKLQNTFENNAMLADSSAEAFIRQADSLRELTGVDDEAIKGAQALLGQFKLTGQQVQQLIPLVVDLSSKMGIDLEAAAKAVGKATQGSAGILARYGIVLDKTKLQADAFGTVMSGLKDTVGGFARERAVEEPWLVLTSDLKELAEQVGLALLPALQDLANGLKGLVPLLKAVAEGFADAFSTETYTSIPIIGGFFHALGVGIESLKEDLGLAGDAVHTAGTDIGEMKAKADLAAAGFYRLSDVVDHTGEAIHNNFSFAGMGTKALHDFRQSAEDDIRGMNDSLTGFSAGWELSAEKAVRAMRGMERQAKQMASDFKALDTEAVPDRFKAFLIEQGPAAVHAFVEGTKREKADFVQAWKGYENATQSAVDHMHAIASSGGRSVGAVLAQGVASGLAAYSPSIYNTVDQVINNAIAAAKKAAGAASPSKKMAELGRDLVRGLKQGMEDEAQTAISAAQDLLQKVIDKSKSFASTIRGGFGGFGQISGAFGTTENPATPGSIAAFFSGQVASAQLFADVLNALQRQGASKGLLAQIAGAGPEALPFAQALLQGGPDLVGQVSGALGTINQLAGKTADRLTNKFFGDKIDELRQDLKDMKDALREWRRADEGQKIVVEIDGQQVATIIKKELLVGATRNGGSTGL